MGGKMNRLFHDHPPECICEGVCFVVDAVGSSGEVWGGAWQLSRAINGRVLVGGDVCVCGGYVRWIFFPLGDGFWAGADEKRYLVVFVWASGRARKKICRENVEMPKKAVVQRWNFPFCGERV
jgi:hypothetical protein